MNESSNSDWQSRLEDFLQVSRNESLTDAQRTELNEILRNHAAARSHAAKHLLDDAAITDCLREQAVSALFREDAQPFATAKATPRSRWLHWRPLAAAAAGIVFGMFCTSMVWAGVALFRRGPEPVAVALANENKNKNQQNRYKEKYINKR